jgi:hypothetical protein
VVANQKMMALAYQQHAASVAQHYEQAWSQMSQHMRAMGMSEPPAAFFAPPPVPPLPPFLAPRPVSPYIAYCFSL